MRLRKPALLLLTGVCDDDPVPVGKEACVWTTAPGSFDVPECDLCWATADRTTVFLLLV